MRQPLLALIGLILLTISILPTSAQGGSISAIIENRSDLSTLAIFLEAAPDVKAILSRGGTYTMFAPNNVAFQNLSSLLDIPLQELLENPDIVTQLLFYHVINGRYNLADLEDLSGQVVLTELQGAFIGVRINEDNAITINNVVEIEQANIQASNGVIHIVNDVLLNRIIASAVDNVNLERAITPNPFAIEETPTPFSTPEPVTPNVAMGSIRFQHLVPDADGVDVYVNSTLLLEDITFANSSVFTSLQPNMYSFTVTAAGGSIDDSLIEPVNVTINNGDFITVSVIGSFENDTLQSLQIEEDFSESNAETSRLTLIHAIDSAPSVDVILNDNISVEDLTFGENITIEIPADHYLADVVISGESTSVLANTIPLRLSYTRFYTLILLGSADEPDFMLNSISMNDVADIQSQFTNTVETVEDVQVSEVNIIETLNSRDEFSILVAVLEAADEDIINRLGAENQEPITLIAPTNRAFENLISTIGVDEDTFLNNMQVVSDILMYHTIEGEILSDDFRASAGTSIVTTLPQNQAFFVTVTNNGTILLNGFVQFAEVDILASNGVIHVIDDVLLPESALSQFGL